MKVEARYCDACGVKIATDDLSDGSAVQVEDSVFYCKDCKAKHAPDAKKSSKPDDKAEKKAKVEPIARSSHRLMARRSPSARLRRKLPPAVTASGDDLLDTKKKKDKPAASPEDKKKKAELREKAREKLLAPKTDKAKKKDKKLDELEILESEASPKKKKKKKKRVDGAETKKKSDEKKVEAAPADESARVEKVEKEEPKAEKKKAAEPAESEPDESARVAKAEKDDKAEKKKVAEPSESEPDESARVAKAEKKKADEPSESEPASQASESEPEAKPAKKKKDESEAESEEEVAKKKKPLVSIGGKKKDGSDVEPDDDTEEVLDRSRPLAKQKTKKYGAPPPKRARGDEDDLDEKEAKAKRPKMPLVPVIAIGALVIVLVGLLAVLAGGGSPKKPTETSDASKTPAGGGPDAKLALDAAVAYAKDCKDDWAFAVARLEAVRDNAPDAVRAEAESQLQDLKSRWSEAASTKWSEVEGAAQAKESSGDFDGAIAAIEEFPPSLRSSDVWQKNGRAKLDDLVIKKLAKQGDPLLAEAKKLFDEKHDAETAMGLLAAYPEEYAKREQDLGQKVRREISRMATLGVMLARKADEETKRKAEEARKAKERQLAAKRRNAVLALGDDAKWESQLSNELFTWTVRPDMKPLGQPGWKGAFKVDNGTLVIKSYENRETYIGKSKLEWQDYVLEFSIKATKGKAWFLGHVSIESNQLGQTTDFPWDKIALPLKEGQWAKIQVRVISKLYDMVIDGGAPKDVEPDESKGKDTGGFGFMVESGGSVEVKDVRVKVLQTKSAEAGGEDEGDGGDDEGK